MDDLSLAGNCDSFIILSMMITISILPSITLIILFPYVSFVLFLVLGWLKTVDQYYYGNRNDIQRATVQNIINSVLKELAWNPDRRFIYIEQAFYQRYMDEHQDDPQIMSLMRQLISQVSKKIDRPKDIFQL